MNPLLTLVSAVFLVIQYLVIKKSGGISRKGFVQQQASLADLNGFIEEYTEGQKIITLFHHEESAIAGFEQRNDQLQDASYRAQIYAGIINPALGSITYDGIDLKDIKKSALRGTLSMVLQDTHLFTGTVRENIRFGRLDATDEEVDQAAVLANADFFIRHLPQGYDTVLTADGSSLSQGQRQLLAIARAAVANPMVLVLDEATSSIDTHTEKLIEAGMNRLMEGRTVFIIAHRLSTVRDADTILVLDHGRIIERGNHKELLDRKGRYYALYTGAIELS